MAQEPKSPRVSGSQEKDQGGKPGWIPVTSLLSSVHRSLTHLGSLEVQKKFSMCVRAPAADTEDASSYHQSLPVYMQTFVRVNATCTRSCQCVCVSCMCMSPCPSSHRKPFITLLIKSHGNDDGKERRGIWACATCTCVCPLVCPPPSRVEPWF